MARKKQFDTDKALDAAMRVFWARGYEASSMQELVDAMGINRASLYDTFGDKKALFLEALDLYVQKVNRANLAILDDGHSAASALENYFNVLIDLSTNSSQRLGCMLANTAVELAPHEPEIERKITSIFERAEATFQNIIERGQSNREFDPSIDPATTASVLMTTVLGLRVRSRCSIPAEDMRKIAMATLQNLGLTKS